MKRYRIFPALLCLCLLLAACAPADPGNLFETEAPTETSAPVETMEMPEEMQELSQNEDLEWMAGIYVGFANCTRERVPVPSHGLTYTCFEDTIQAVVSLQSGIHRDQPYSLIVLADGAPVEFQVDGKAYTVYPVTLNANDPVILNLEFPAEFPLNLGRLDFLLFFAGNPGTDYYVTRCTITFRLDGQLKAPSKLQDTIPLRGGVKSHFSGDFYSAWLWNAKNPPDSGSDTGPRELTPQEKNPLLVEVINARPGLHRVVLMVDNTILTMDGVPYVDWEADGTNMLQLPIDLQQIPEDAASFYTVSTPLDPETFDIIVKESPQIALVPGE